jgi:hypothetical protein
MKSPPSLNDIESALFALRLPAERRLLQIQDLRDRFLESHRHSTAVVDPTFVEHSNRLRQSVRQHQRNLDRLPQAAFRTLILCTPDTERLSVIALVPDETDAPSLVIGEWKVACVRCSFHLLRCRVGDLIPQGLVVSVNGSPVLADSQRRRKLDALRAPPLPPRELKRRERAARGAKRERFIAERLRREDALQEVFYERRRAIEEREKRLREQLRRAMHGPPVAEAEVCEDELLALSPSDWSEAAVDDKPDDDATDTIYITGAADSGDPASSATVSAAPMDLGWVLTAFGVGCVTGLFIVPRFFSLVGALFATVAGLGLRLLVPRRA